jgi:lipoate-protein ligase A
VKLEAFRSRGRPSHDLAFEGELLDRAAAGRASALVTSWPGPVVVLGYAQPPTDVDLEWCREEGIPVLRRLSGGTGVIHRGDLGVSLVLPAKHPWAGGIVGLYDRFLGVLELALGSVGGRVARVAEPRRGSRVRSPICFEDQLADTLTVDGRKAVGCSQTRRKNGVLIHAAVLLGLDAELYARVFGVDPGRVSMALAPAVTGVPSMKVGDAVLARLADDLGLVIEENRSPITAPEHLLRYRGNRWSPVPDGGIP